MTTLALNNFNHMGMERKLIRKYTTVGQPGFLGRGHIAHPVILGNYSDSDPFILLMDDRLDKKDEEPVGGPHPHAGFETVTLMLEGELGVGSHKMKAGDLQIMTAGSGVIHTETIDKKTQMRLLQLWLILPQKDRWTKPRVQDLPLEHVPEMTENGVHIKLYSGSLSGLKSPIQNYTAFILADIQIEPYVTTTFQIPADYNTFLYVLNGSLKLGHDQETLEQDQVGWLDLYADQVPSDLKITAGIQGVRFVLYSGKPQGDPIVSHGPFIGDNTEDIRRLYQEYRQDKMQDISSISKAQQIAL